MSEITTDSGEVASKDTGVLTSAAHSELIEPDQDATPIPPAEPAPVSVPLPQTSTGEVDVAWEVLDVLTGPGGLL